MAAIPIPAVNTPTYQSWGAQVANTLKGLKGYALGVADGNKVADAGSHVQYTPAEFGLATIIGGVITCDRQSPGDNGFAVFIAECWVVTPTQFVGRMMLINLSNGTTNVAPASSARVCHAIAWGTPAGATSRPGTDDEDDEINPLD